MTSPPKKIYVYVWLVFFWSLSSNRCYNWDYTFEYNSGSFPWYLLWKTCDTVIVSLISCCYNTSLRLRLHHDQCWSYSWCTNQSQNIEPVLWSGPNHCIIWWETWCREVGATACLCNMSWGLAGTEHGTLNIRFYTRGIPLSLLFWTYCWKVGPIPSSWSFIYVIIFIFLSHIAYRNKRSVQKYPVPWMHIELILKWDQHHGEKLEYKKWWITQIVTCFYLW